jgi:uncharacterized protein
VTIIVERLALLDWKRRVFELYSEIRRADDPRAAWQHWAAVRRELFATHPSSPIPPGDRDGYAGPHLFDYNPQMRVPGNVEGSANDSYSVPTSTGPDIRLSRLGIVHFELHGAPQQLDLLWLEGYGGGIFLPFRDASAGRDTYGAGRYLLDSVKGADLGSDGNQLILDFNFAYNPSCSYDPRWACPLAPPGNHLEVEVRAGERLEGPGLPDPSS